jgi:hypothetical protein
LARVKIETKRFHFAALIEFFEGWSGGPKNTPVSG